jgi:HPt (histidine-containing phosphotransfer) domain-containing protein
VQLDLACDTAAGLDASGLIFTLFVRLDPMDMNMDANSPSHGRAEALAGDDKLQLSPVDLKHLRRYTLGDRALEHEVLELFLAQLPATIASLGAASSDRDWHMAAHTLKGSGRAVGAWRIARLAEQAERSAPWKNPSQLQQTLAMIVDAAEEARSYIHDVYGQR